MKMKKTKSDLVFDICAFVATFLILIPINVLLKKLFDNDLFYYLYYSILVILLYISHHLYLVKRKAKLQLFRIIIFGFIVGFITSVFSYSVSCIFVKGLTIFINTFKDPLSFFTGMFILFGWLYGVLLAGLIYLSRKFVGKKEIIV